jgi:phosphoribosylformylglycinamidine cyclo-ligase
MDPGEFDLVGFAVGVAERDRLIVGQHVASGDVLIGLPSPNLRSNGYSLARRVLLQRAGRNLDDPAYEGAHHSLADELLSPSVVYAPAVLSLIDAVDVRAIAHVTGGGIAGNLNRVLPARCDAVVERRSWESPRIFGEIQRLGDISDDEMAKVFNLGLGMIAVVPSRDALKALDVLRSAGLRGAAEIGQIVDGSGAVHLR